MTTANAHPGIRISLRRDVASDPQQPFTFSRSFTIGRQSDCDVCIPDGVVSRHHADVFLEEGEWWIQDRQSANGIFIDGRRIDRAVLFGSGQVQLGSGGPVIDFAVEAPAAEPARDAAPTQPVPPPSAPSSPTTLTDQSLDHYKDHYFSKDTDGPAGEHTMMVRRAYAEVQKKQRRFYGVIIGLIALMLIGTGTFAWYKHSQVAEQRRLATEVFYTMRALEIDLIKLRVDAEKRKSEAAMAQIEAAKARKQQLEKNYQRYVNSLDIYSRGMSEKEKIILRMAHRFGECEINMPDGFVDKVSGFIDNWRSSKRLARVIRRAKRQRYIPRILAALESEDLPDQFFYLAVQESNLNPEAVGPPTRFGIAKGMWQFIPSTAEKYGLRVGPLKNEAVVDVLDERQDFEKSTRAAARYLRDIYTTDAQASGLLVMASYNWGERRVIRLIQTMPEDPRERNFWKLITTYRDKVPDETYDYVFSIFTAAVIGENPRLFGFDFDNPLKEKGRQ